MKNQVNCGVFAVANAIELLSGSKIESVCYDPSLMRDHLLTCPSLIRDHLLTCMQLEEFSPFPRTTKRVSRCRASTLFHDVFCVCRDAYFDADCDDDDGKFMAMCSMCKEWFHKKCLGISRKVFTDENIHKVLQLLNHCLIDAFRPW